MSMNHRTVPTPWSNDGCRTTRRIFEIPQNKRRNHYVSFDNAVKEQRYFLPNLLPCILKNLSKFLLTHLDARIKSFECQLKGMMNRAFLGVETPSEAFLTYVATYLGFMEWYTYRHCEAGVKFQNLFNGVCRCVVRQQVNMALNELLTDMIISRLLFFSSIPVVHYLGGNPSKWCVSITHYLSGQMRHFQ